MEGLGVGMGRHKEMGLGQRHRIKTRREPNRNTVSGCPVVSAGGDPIIVIEVLAGPIRVVYDRRRIGNGEVQIVNQTARRSGAARIVAPGQGDP